MTINRCTECGSWEAQCSADKPYDGCGCARCLSATNLRLREEAKMWQDKYEKLKINRASCCMQMEDERDEFKQKYDILLNVLNQAAPEWIGENITDIQECLRDCNSEFAMRLYRAKNVIMGPPIDDEAEARFEKLLAKKRAEKKNQ